MRRLIAYLWNSGINFIGWIIGRILNAGVRRGWIYFPFASEALSRLPFSLGWKLRRAIFAQVFPVMGTDAVVHHGVVFDDPRTQIGEDVWISSGCYVDYASIGNHVLIGPHCVLLSGGQHHNFDRTDIPIKQQGNRPKVAIVIADGAWIGANATVMASIGQHAIVGAGSVVTKPVPAYAIVAGNPARILRMRKPESPDDALSAESLEALPLIAAGRVPRR